MAVEAQVCLLFLLYCEIKLTNSIEGNITAASATPELDPATLETPTLKGEVYTTGRGGSGNMAHNTDPEASRRAQDVVG